MASGAAVDAGGIIRPSLRGVILSALIASAMPATATAGDMLVGVGFGSGDVNFDADILAANNSISDDDLVAEFWVGYRFDSKVILEGGASQGLSIDFFLPGDSFSIQDVRVLSGYVFELGERFEFLPELGVSFWDIDTEDFENAFFGSTRTDVDDSGTDLMWRISGSVRVAMRARFYAAYSEADYDFGEATRLNLGIKWQF
jgi:hypothetical protein